MSKAIVQFNPTPSAQHQSNQPQQPLWSNAQRNHGLLPSPPRAHDAQPANADNPLLSFVHDWRYSPRQHSATRAVGLNILGDLQRFNVAPNAKYPIHPADPLIPVDLSKMTVIDIRKLQYDALHVLADLRTPNERSARPLKDCDALRTALDYGYPIAFKMSARSKKGLHGARLQVPDYILERPGRTVVAGEGTFCAIPPSPEHFSDAILLQTTGKCVLVTFPMTTENAGRYNEGFVPSDPSHWHRAVREPGAVLRVLSAGDCAPLPPQHMRFIMSLGDGNKYSATALVYIAHHLIVEARKRKHHGDDERPTKKANLSSGSAESSLDPRLRLLDQANDHLRAASRNDSSTSRSPSRSPGRNAGSAAPVRDVVPELLVVDAPLQPVDDAHASDLADNDTLSASSDIDSIDEALNVGDGPSIWDRVDMTGLFPN